MKHHFKPITLVLAAVLMTISVTSCATVRGMGRDVEHAGNSIQKAGQ